PAPVLPADGALLAVTVPAGSHTVELTYRPPMLLAGAALSGLALLLAATLWAGNWRLSGGAHA
ncbi:MAG: hypothetical protein IT318_26870, partial [Anaerolineales bacterium]|nr:hypothetical protein [Anaerolineales bacterium]